MIRLKYTGYYSEERTRTVQQLVVDAGNHADGQIEENERLIDRQGEILSRLIEVLVRDENLNPSDLQYVLDIAMPGTDGPEVIKK